MYTTISNWVDATLPGLNEFYCGHDSDLETHVYALFLSATKSDRAAYVYVFLI